MHHIEHLLVSDINAGCAQHLIADVGVKKAIIAGQRRDGFGLNRRLFCGIQSTPLLPRFPAPGIVARDLTAF